jgi:hypothetical protein
MLSRPAVEQASVVPFVARIAVLVAAGCFLPALPATAEDDVPPTAICPNPELSLSGVISVPDGPSAGAEYVVCMPAPEAWIGDLVIFVHGIVDPWEGPGKIESILGQLDTNGLIIPATTNELGYAFAVLSRSDLGLSDAQLAKAELIELVAAFAEEVDASPVFPEFEGLVYLVGPSLGGLLTTLLVEETAEVFDGGLAACGPIGSLRRQVNYWGDLLVVFDYFFPQFELINPPSEVPPAQADVALVRENILDVWGEGDGGLGGAVRAALEASPETTQDIATVVRVATDPTGNESVAETVFEVLEAAVLITNDGIATLGGNPFGNERRVVSAPMTILRSISGSSAMRPTPMRSQPSRLSTRPRARSARRS